jgi:hypothetical protein
MKEIVAVLLLTSLTAAPAWAQADFSRVRLEPGDRARVFQASGIEVAGVVTAVAPGRLTIGEIAFEPDDVLKIERRGDSILTGGTLVGVGMGAFLGTAVIDCYGSSRGGASCLLAGMTAYGSLGLLIDFLHEGQTTIFRGKRRTSAFVAPVITGDKKAIVLSLGF